MIELLAEASKRELSLTLLSQRLNARVGFEFARGMREKVRGVYRV